MDENNNPIRRARSRSVKKNVKITKFFKTNKIKVALPSEKQLDQLSNYDLNKLVDKIKPNYIIDFASICMVNESWVNPKYYFEVN